MKLHTLMFALFALACFCTLSLRVEPTLSAQEKNKEEVVEEGSDDYEKAKDEEATTKEFEDKDIRSGITREEAKQIDAAIEKGAKWLSNQQTKEGQFPGFAETHVVGGQALTLLTLLKCGVHWEDPIIEKGKDWLYTYYRYGWKDKGRIPNQVKTYSQGLMLMFLEAYYQDHPKPEKKKEKADKDDFITPEEAERRRKKEEKEAEKRRKRGTKYRKVKGNDKYWIKELTEAIDRDQKEDTGMWAYPGGNYPKHAENAGIKITGDFSNTQYAMLGLLAASRLGFKVKKSKTYKTLADFILARQDKKGPKVNRTKIIEKEKGRTRSIRRYAETDNARGWSYTGYYHHVKDEKQQHERLTGSMTTAALACLVIAKSQLLEWKAIKEGDEYDEKVNKSVWDGIAWMTANFTVSRNPTSRSNCEEQGGHGGWHYYYLYGLERLGILAGRDFFGEHEWYPEGARLLLSDQKETGEWPGGNGPAQKEPIIRDTCFALLFLKRATMPLKKPVPAPNVTGGHRKD